MESELTTVDRVAILVWRLQRGDRITVAQAARLTEQSPSGAYKMLVRLQLHIPIYCADDRFWCKCEDSR